LLLARTSKSQQKTQFWTGVMGIFLQFTTSTHLLATEAAAEAGGFGLNFDIFEANLINLGIVIAVVVYFGRGFLTKLLGDRSAAIAEAIKAAEARKQKASAALADQQQKLAQAQAEAAKIRASADAAAQSASAAILAKAAEDVRRMREAAAQELGSEQERIINELRQRIAAMAAQRAEADLADRLNDDVQQRLIDRSISLLTGGN
jgi:F-type H+-transporting ATPase subunit b